MVLHYSCKKLSHESGSDSFLVYNEGPTKFFRFDFLISFLLCSSANNINKDMKSKYLRQFVKKCVISDNISGANILAMTAGD